MEKKKKLTREQELEVKILTLEGKVRILSYQKEKLQQSYLELQNEILSMPNAKRCAMDDLGDEYEDII